MRPELDAAWSGRPPTADEHRAIARVADRLVAEPRGWNRILWRPPLRGTALVVKAVCTACAAHGLPILLSSTSVLAMSEGALVVEIDRLGTHACVVTSPA
jgi:hypothetical protein